MKRTLEIIETAVSLGATLAGIAGVAGLRGSPSHRAAGKPRPGAGTRSVLVLGLAHGPEAPELDWWGGEGGTPGNRELERIAGQLIRRLGEAFGPGPVLLPYHAGRGGVFLKDAAVLAGLGVIGRNNLVITPGFGPRVRWRAIGLRASLAPSGGPAAFDPCGACDMPCARACPQGALAGGAYSRERCQVKMRRDEAVRSALPEGGEGGGPSAGLVKYCRACELSCPVAAPGASRGG